MNNVRSGRLKEKHSAGISIHLLKVSRGPPGLTSPYERLINTKYAFTTNALRRDLGAETSDRNPTPSPLLIPGTERNKKSTCRRSNPGPLLQVVLFVHHGGGNKFKYINEVTKDESNLPYL